MNAIYNYLRKQKSHQFYPMAFYYLVYFISKHLADTNLIYNFTTGTFQIRPFNIRVSVSKPGFSSKANMFFL